MNITKKEIDSLNAVLTVEINKDDYSQKVENILNNYRKTANIPGFRKGHIPMGMVKKQFGKAVLVEEVNKLLQDKLHNYLVEEKLDILGNPLPKNEAEINWDSEDFAFEFELGLAPEFNVDINKKATTHYKIVADKKMIDNQMKAIQKQYGKLISQSEVIKDAEITGVFLSEENGIDKKTTVDFEDLKGKKQKDALLGSKVGDIIVLKSKGLFKEDNNYARYFGVSHEDAKGLDIDVTFTVEEINTREVAELNQELFDKLFGEGVVSSEKEMREKIKEDSERQFVQQSDQKLLNDVVETLIDNTKFDLPKDFLTRWIKSTGEGKLTEKEAAEEFERSEKGLRYQLIEGKLRADNESLQINFDELKAYASDMIKAQMMQFGQLNPSDEEVDGIVARIMSNEEEVKRMSEQLNTNKLLQFFKENAKLKEKEVTYDQFIKEAYA